MTAKLNDSERTVRYREHGNVSAYDEAVNVLQIWNNRIDEERCDEKHRRNKIANRVDHWDADIRRQAHGDNRFAGIVLVPDDRQTVIGLSDERRLRQINGEDIAVLQEVVDVLDGINAETVRLARIVRNYAKVSNRLVRRSQLVRVDAGEFHISRSFRASYALAMVEVKAGLAANRYRHRLPCEHLCYRLRNQN